MIITILITAFIVWRMSKEYYSLDINHYKRMYEFEKNSRDVWVSYLNMTVKDITI